MNTKQITVTMELPGSLPKAVRLAPGATVADALRLAGLDPRAVYLNTPDRQRLLAPVENLHRLVNPGQQVWATPALDAG